MESKPEDSGHFKRLDRLASVEGVTSLLTVGLDRYVAYRHRLYNLTAAVRPNKGPMIFAPPSLAQTSTHGPGVAIWSALSLQLREAPDVDPQEKFDLAMAEVRARLLKDSEDFQQLTQVELCNENGPKLWMEEDVATPQTYPWVTINVKGEAIICRMATAIEYQWLLLVGQQKWREVLQKPVRLAMTRYGRHGICARQEEGKLAHLIATALFLELGPNRSPLYEQENLVRTDFFSKNEIFVPHMNRSNYLLDSEKHFQEFPEDRHDINDECIPEEPKNTGEYVEGMLQAEGYEHSTEIIQCCFDEGALRQAGIELLYRVGDGMLAEALNLGKRYSIVIVEDPLFHHWAELQRMSGLLCYSIISQASIKGRNTYQLKIYNRAIVEAVKGMQAMDSMSQSVVN